MTAIWTSLATVGEWRLEVQVCTSSVTVSKICSSFFMSGGRSVSIFICQRSMWIDYVFYSHFWVLVDSKMFVVIVNDMACQVFD